MILDGVLTFSHTFRYKKKNIFQAEWCVNIYHSDRNSRTAYILRILKHKKALASWSPDYDMHFWCEQKSHIARNNSVAFVVTQVYSFAFFSSCE